MPPKRNYKFEKRQNELAKQKKKQKKEERKLMRKQEGDEDQCDTIFTEDESQTI